MSILGQPHIENSDNNSLQAVLAALRQSCPRGADGMGLPGRPLRRSTRRYSSQRDEFHRELRPVANALYKAAPFHQGRKHSRARGCGG